MAYMHTTDCCGNTYGGSYAGGRYMGGGGGLAGVGGPVVGGGVVGGPAMGGGYMGSYAGGSYVGGGMGGSYVGGMRPGAGLGYGGPYGGYAGGDACGCGPGDGCGPGTACGGCAAGCASCGVGCGGISGTTFAVVGEGVGDYVASTTYKYVGMGAGNVGLVPIPAPGCSCLWTLCFLPLLLIPLLFLGQTTTTSTTTTTTTSGPILVVPTPGPGNDINIVPPSPAPGNDIPPEGCCMASPPGSKPSCGNFEEDQERCNAQSGCTWDSSNPTCNAPQGPQGVCKVFGDPHVTTFDNQHVSFYSQGEYWIVKSSTVWMQGRYLPTPVTNGLSVMKELAIGGPFLQGPDGKKNVLRISALRATFNDHPIIPGFPDTWTNDKPKIEVVTDSNGELMQASRQGKQMHVVHVKLPLSIEIQINRWNEPGEGDYINMKLTMSSQPQQDGHCGNFNGNPGDDTRELIRSRVGTTGVDPANLLFHTKTPVTPANRPDLNNCPKEKADQAREACRRVCQSGIPSKECMIDVCFGGAHMAELGGYDC